MGTLTFLDNLPVGTVVGLDTAPIIYLIENHPRYEPIVSHLFDDCLEPGLNFGVTSVATLSEVLVKPFGAVRPDLVERYRELLTHMAHLSLMDITRAIAERAAGLRSRYGTRLPDALQVATALEHGASHFVTNDRRLRAIIDFKVLVLEDFVEDATS